jgi:hypothetical protein
MFRAGLCAFLIVVCVGLVGWLPSSFGQASASQATASQPATTQAGQPARRVLLREDFETPKGPWSGSIITRDLPPGSKRALAAVPTDTHWARRVTVGDGRTLRATQDMVLTFRYRISKDIPITIYIFDSTQKDNLRYDIKKPVVGEWADVTVSINKDFRRNDGSAGKVQPGDALKGMSFLAGVTGKDEFDLAVDDVEVTGRG